MIGPYAQKIIENNYVNSIEDIALYHYYSSYTHWPYGLYEDLWTKNIVNVCRRIPKSNIIHLDWRGTHGIGDYMMGLNFAHNLSLLSKQRVTLRFHFKHKEDFVFHPEDPETIIERGSYIHNFYWRKNDVSVEHHFESCDKKLFIEMQFLLKAANQRKGTPDGRSKPFPALHSWVFDDKYFLPANPKSVVMWTPYENATEAPRWKRILAPQHWEIIKKKIKAAGFTVTELTYRTPVREAMHHIQKCSLVVGYDGMWHIIAKLLCKPTIIVGNNAIIKILNPQALWIRDWNEGTGNNIGRVNLEDLLDNMTTLISLAENQATTYTRITQGIYDEYRSSSY